MKSLKNGIITSKAEITNISEHGFWLFYNDREYFLPFQDYPWFRNCKLSEIFDFKADDKGNFRWTKLDVDLNVRILQNTEKYPLIYKKV
jgi:hypothetical protein